jgi:hypothetical protein
MSTRAATIGICDDRFAITATGFSKLFYSPKGARQLLVVTDASLDPSRCDSISIPQPAASILWSGLLPRHQDLDAQHQLILQGTFLPDAVSVSEIIDQSPPPVAATPGRLDHGFQVFDTRTFGIEERAKWIDRSNLRCDRGIEAAGVQLRTNFPWPQNGQLQITASGAGEFAIAIADEEHIQDEASVPIGLIVVAEGATRTERYVLPDNSAPWTALTLNCPQAAASLKVDSIALRPRPLTGPDAVTPRSAWVWNPNSWLLNPGFFWTLHRLEAIDAFYVTVPVNEAGEVVDAQSLRAFIRDASARGISIWAVIGDRHDVLPESLPPLQARISAYRRYNDRVEAVEQLAGIQLDIEPYLLPGYHLATDHWRERYLQTIAVAHQTIGDTLAMDLVMPVWWGTHPDWGSKLLDELDLPRISLTIMNYRTDYEQLVQGMTPFLNWGILQQQPVRVALETGSLADETQRLYSANPEAGELWVMQTGAVPVLVLFAESQQGLPGHAFSLREERVFSAGVLTFAGDQPRLHNVARRLAEELRSWSSFQGIALHGLDEIYADRPND